MDDARTTPVRVARRRELAEEWALVLASQGLSPKLQRGPEGFVLSVPSEEAETAASALAAYEAENPTRAPLRPRPIGPIHVRSAIGVAAALMAFFLVTGPRDPEAHWFACGSADAARILGGELWRAVTALTLHADLGHVLANAASATLFLSAVFAALGPGFGGALVLLAGVGGNLLNAFFQGPPHNSVGASTAVFGAVGALAGLAVVGSRRRGTRGRRIWTPVAAGLALLAMLGTGERVDVGAHLYGLLVGAVLGSLAALAWPRPPALRWQLVLGAGALGGVLYCWGVALEPGLCEAR